MSSGILGRSCASTTTILSRSSSSMLFLPLRKKVPGQPCPSASDHVRGQCFRRISRHGELFPHRCHPDLWFFLMFSPEEMSQMHEDFSSKGTFKNKDGLDVPIPPATSVLSPHSTVNAFDHRSFELL